MSFTGPRAKVAARGGDDAGNASGAVPVAGASYLQSAGWSRAMRVYLVADTGVPRERERELRALQGEVKLDVC